MARSKKTIKKSANKSVNVVVNVNSHNKKKKITQPRSAHPTIFVNPSGNTGFSEHGLTQQLLHHFILNNRELPKIEYATTDLHKKVDEPKPFATIRPPSEIVKDDKPLLEPTPMTVAPELPLTDEVKPRILETHTEFTPIIRRSPTRSPSPPHTTYPRTVDAQRTYFFDKYGLKGISHFNLSDLARLRDVEHRNGDIESESNVIKRERRDAATSSSKRR